jgi:hypothetical protein
MKKEMTYKGVVYMIIKEINNDTITINNMILSDLRKFIEKKLDENSLWVDDVRVYEHSGNIRIEVDIKWGDWKHEHRRLDFLIYDIVYEYNKDLVSNFYKITQEITDEDGSDTYSAVHIYEIEVD